MTNLVPYQLAKDQCEVRHRSNPYNPYSSPTQELSYFSKTSQEAPPIGALILSTNSSLTNSTAMTNDYSTSDLRDDEEQIYPSIYSTYENNRALPYQQHNIMNTETRQDDGQASPPKIIISQVPTSQQIKNKKLEDNHMNINKKLNARVQAAKVVTERTRYRLQSEKSKISWGPMNVPLALNPRQIENKELKDNHMKINKRLDPRAQKRQEAARRTRLQIQQAKLVKQTESSRPKKTIAPDNVRYLETVDGVENEKIIKVEQAAKMQAVWMVSDPDYKFNDKAGLAAYTFEDLMSNYRNPSTQLGPFA